MVLGSTPSTTSAIALICSAVVPQHPPTILTFFSLANSLIYWDVLLGILSYYTKTLGNPSLG